MGKKAPSAPAPPDPAATAAAQGAINTEAARESARLNQINQVTPYGNVTYSGELGGPNRTQTLILPPGVQAILDAQTNVGGNLANFATGFVPRVAEGLSQPFNTADYGGAPVADPAERQRIEANLFGRLEPQFNKDEDRLRNTLANQGIGQGAEAFGSAFDDFNRAKTDARLAAANAGGQEYARDFGLQNQSYQQRISDALLNRTQGLNEVSALLQGAPAINQPQAPQPAQFGVNPADFQGAQALQYQGLLNNYNQQMGSRNALMGGLAGLGGSLGAAALISDARVKTDIKRIGKTDDGLPVYTYRYIWGGPVQMGVMAQDLKDLRPEAVHTDGGGVMMVDYSMVS